MIASGPRFGLRVALPPQAALQNAILSAKKRQLPINRMTHCIYPARCSEFAVDATERKMWNGG